MTDDRQKKRNSTPKTRGAAPKRTTPPSKPAPASPTSSATSPTAPAADEPSWLKKLRTDPRIRVIDDPDFASVHVGAPTNADTADDLEALVDDVDPETAESLEILGGVRPPRPRTAN